MVKPAKSQVSHDIPIALCIKSHVAKDPDGMLCLAVASLNPVLGLLFHIQGGGAPYLVKLSYYNTY